MLGLMTVKRHKQLLSRMVHDSIESQFQIMALSEEIATLRAQLPTRGDKGKFAKRNG